MEVLSDIQKIWPQWQEPDIQRFARDVLEVVGLEDTEMVLAAAAIDRWLVHIFHFTESQRFALLRQLLTMSDENTLRDDLQRAIAAVEDEEETRIPGIFLSLYDSRWAGWTGGQFLFDMLSFDKLNRAPTMIVTTTTAGLVQMYVTTKAYLRKVSNDSLDAQTA